MSVEDKDNRNFEFIKEQVIEKKRRKIKRWLFPFMMTVVMAILFGIIAAVTFVIAEPRLYDFLRKDKDTRTPVSFPTQYPEEQEPGTTDNTTGTKDPSNNDQTTKDPEADPANANGGSVTNPEDEDIQQKPDTVYMSIDADIEDYLGIYEDIRAIAYNVSKSIVNIVSTSTVTDPWFGKAVEESITTTGVIIHNNEEELLILVSYDRIEATSSIRIKFSDTVYVNTTLLDYDREVNLAIISAAIKDIPEIYLNGLQEAVLGESYTISVGSPILAMGNPNGYPGSTELGMITTKGIGASITDNRLELFLTDIGDNANSDGIIVNFKGEVIGLITRTLKDEKNVNLNTAIGISKIKPIITRMGNQEPTVYFGIKADDLTEAVRREYLVTNGIFVNEVQANSPAFTGGLKNGDIILQVNDQTILNTYNFNNAISIYQPGDEIKVKVKRLTGAVAKEMILTVKLAEKAK